jgi:hypothetical protein
MSFTLYLYIAAPVLYSCPRKAGIVRQVCGYRLIMFGVRVVQMPSIAVERRTGCTGVLPVRRKAGIVRQVSAVAL